MTNLETLKKSIRGKNKNLRAASWVKKAGGIKNVSEDMAARIVKICRLQDPAQEKGKGK